VDKPFAGCSFTFVLLIHPGDLSATQPVISWLSYFVKEQQKRSRKIMAALKQRSVVIEQ